MFAFVSKVNRDLTLSPEGEKVLRETLARHVERNVSIEIKRHYEKRTDQQNKTVMGLWLDLICDELGYPRYEREKVYNWIKSECWYEMVEGTKGTVKMKFPKETKNLTIPEYAVFMRTFQQFVEEFLHIILPNPNPHLAKI